MACVVFIASFSSVNAPLRVAGPVGLHAITSSRLEILPMGSHCSSTSQMRSEALREGVAWRHLLPSRLVENQAAEDAREAAFEAWKDQVCSPSVVALIAPMSFCFRIVLNRDFVRCDLRDFGRGLVKIVPGGLRTIQKHLL
eukprot:SAG31_NODE_1628_length_7704_cov_27.599606_1_plen_141_part_00